MLIWLALDGVGHPLDAPAGSPWETELPTLRPLIDQGYALDATLGVPGLPQSATGQSCWLTGQDAVRLMGEHFGPRPGPTLQKLLREASWPVQLARAGRRIALANVYLPEFLAQQEEAVRTGGRNQLGCFPYAFRAAGPALNPPGLPLIRASLGLSYQAPWEPQETRKELAQRASALARVAPDYDLLVLDLWWSDLIGHAGSVSPQTGVRAAAVEWLARLDLLLNILLDQGCSVVLSSDHGNMEDLSHGSHTLARVPWAWGSPDGRLGLNYPPSAGYSTVLQAAHTLGLWLK